MGAAKSRSIVLRRRTSVENSFRHISDTLIDLINLSLQHHEAIVKWLFPWMLSQFIYFSGAFLSSTKRASVFDFIPLVYARSAEPISTAVSLGGQGRFQQADAALHLKNGLVYIYEAINFKLLFYSFINSSLLSRRSPILCCKILLLLMEVIWHFG